MISSIKKLRWLRQLVHRARDLQQIVRRRRVKPHGPRSKYGLLSHQLYPMGENFYPCLQDEALRSLNGVSFNEETPIASIGSCFAEEISRDFLERKYNYILEEHNPWAFSAAWGRVFCIPNLHQIVRYSLSDEIGIETLESPQGWIDPMRENNKFHATQSEAEEAIRKHRAASRDVFRKARVLVLTAGQNEAWRDRETGLYLGVAPMLDADGKIPERFENVRFGFEENHAALEDCLDRLFAFNPELKIILTVSPVASSATFKDSSVVVRSFANKALLRHVVDKIVEEYSDRVGYFPSFEMVLAYNPATLQYDNRHVKYGTVERIFSVLRSAIKR